MQNPCDLPYLRHPAVYRFAIAVLCLFGFWMYYPALSLPHSLIDDYVFLENTDRWVREYRAAGWEQALSHDVGVKQGVFNIAFMLAGTFHYIISGGQPHHYIRLMILAWVCTGLVLLCRRIMPRTQTSAYVALAGAVLFLVGEVPGGIDMQSLRANWFRHFCSDAEGTAFLAIEAIALFRMHCNLTAGRRAWPMMLLAIFGGYMAFAYKIPFFGIAVGPVAIIGAAAYVAGDRRLGHRYMATFAAIIVLFLAHNIYLRSIGQERDADPFAASFSFAPAHLKSGLMTYLANYWGLLGPMFPAILGGMLLLGVHLWAQRRTSEKTAFLGFWYFFAFVACAFIIYVPWNHRLARYMVSCFFGICILFTLVSGYGIHALRLLWQEKPIHFLWIPVGMALTLLPPLILCILLAAACAVTLVLKYRFTVPLLAGVMLAGFGHRLAITPMVRNGTNVYYVGGEHVNWKVTLDVLRHNAAGRTICFAGNPTGEYPGSIKGFLRRMGVEHKLYGLGDTEHCTSDSLVLVYSRVSPPDLQAQVQSLPLVREYDLPASSYKVPVSFWRYREKLFEEGSDKLPYAVWSEDFLWRLYDPKAAGGSR